MLLLSQSLLILNVFLSFLCLLAEATPTARDLQPHPVAPRQESEVPDPEPPLETPGFEAMLLSNEGPGCPTAGDVEISMPAGTLDIVIEYRSFTVRPSARIADCEVKFQVHHPDDWAVGVMYTKADGVFSLAAGNEAAISSELEYGDIFASRSPPAWKGPRNGALPFPVHGELPLYVGMCGAGETETEFRVRNTIWVNQLRTGSASFVISTYTLGLKQDSCP